MKITFKKSEVKEIINQKIKIVKCFLYGVLLILGVVLICSTGMHINTIHNPKTFTSSLGVFILIIGLGSSSFLIYLYYKKLERKINELKEKGDIE